VLAFRKEQRDIKAQAPVGPSVRSVGVIAATDLDADRLLSDLQNLTDKEVDWHGPLVVHPVVSRLAVNPEGRVRLRGVSEEGLKKRRADVLVIVIAANTPDLVGEDADGPALFLHERNERRPEAPLIRPEQAVCSCWIVADRAKAPDDATGTGCFGREEEALRGVAKA
jgi:hypothetical protein